MVVGHIPAVQGWPKSGQLFWEAHKRFFVPFFIQLVKDRFEKFFDLHDPRTPLYQEKLLFYASQRTGIEW